LTVEGVGGDALPYLGYVTCDVTIPLTDSTTFTKTIPVLIVPDTRYNTQTPCLIGTNFLSKIPTDSAPFSTYIPSVRSAVQVLQLRTQQLNESCGVYGRVLSCADQVIPPFTTTVTSGKAAVTVAVRQQIALAQGTKDLPIVPGVTQISEGVNTIMLEITNSSDKPLAIKAGQELAVLHQASIVTSSSEKGQKSDLDKFLESFDFQHLSETDKSELQAFLTSNRDVFAMNSSEMGCTNRVTHTIELLDEIPFKEKCRPIPPSAYDELREHLAELTSAGIIKRSKSPYCSNIVLVRKKDGSLRLCVDYRKLNSRTKKDAYNLPRTDALIDCLQGAKFFASLDFFSGYHQVAMDPEAQERTAFSAGPLGFFQYTRMPFGLCNSPSTFQRLMEEVLEGLTMVKCAVYIDDIIVFAPTKTELYERLSEVFDRLRQAHLTLKPKKCSFFQNSVDFLGHSVSAEGVRCSNKHLEAVTSWPEPSNVQQLQTFLGFTGFFRRFIAGYSTIAYPMLKLLKGSEKKNHKSPKRRKSQHDYVPWEWGKEQQDAFNALKASLTSTPLLVYPDFSKPFTLHVDASRRGLGAVLYQENHGKLHVVAYASRSLTGSEKNYTVHKLEFLALKWAVTAKFHQYLYGRKFRVFTDHNPLVYVTSTAKLDANGHRWLETLGAYDFSIHYKPGKGHADADGLSRRPHPETEERQSTKIISPEIFKEICALVAGDQEFAGVAESLGLPPQAVSSVARLSYPVAIDWAAEQERDPDTARVKQLVRSGNKPTERQRKAESAVVLRLLSHWETLLVKDGVLLKQSKLEDEVLERIVIPAHKQKECLYLVHDDMGHLGRDKTLSLAQERFYWIGLTKDIEHKVKTCHRCICAKAPNLPERAPLVNIVTSRPMELVCIDFLSLETAVGGFDSILVVTDHFTRYACAFPTRNQEAKTVAKLLVDEYFVHYGIPERLHSDQGANFQSRVIDHLCKLLGIKKSRTTPYHPQGDGMTERFNKTLISMLKTLDPAKKPRWKDHVASLVHAYNCTRHESTKHSPFFLMFGRQPRLALDVFLGREPAYTSTVDTVRQKLEAAYRAASEAARKAAGRQAEHYNQKVRGQKLQPGDAVLLRNVGLKGKHKIADKWQQEPFTVVDQPNPDIPVYRIQRGDQRKVIHRNHLLPVALPYRFDRDEIGEATGTPPKLPQDMDQEAEEEDGSNLQFAMVTHDDVGPDPEEYALQPDYQGQTLHEALNESTNSSNRMGTLSPSALPARQGSLPPAREPMVVELQTETTEADLPGPEGETVVVPEAPDRVSMSDDGPELRRSQRTRKLPARFGDFVMSRNVTTNCDPEWRDRVTILLSLLELFPGQQKEIFTAITHVITVLR
jgi:transposase InsO family protein